MPLKLALPPVKPLFTTKIRVRVSEVNYGAHVGNESYLVYAQEIRVRFLESFDCKETNIGNQLGLIMSDAQLVYKSESFLGNELEVSLYADEVSKFGFNFFYRIFNLTTSKDAAIIATGMICFNYEKRKVVSLPEAFAIKLKSNDL